MGYRKGTLENLGMNKGFWKNRKVFLTGHTGFKGGWTALWLSKMGAKVYGYSLKPPTKPSFFLLTKLKNQISQSITGNILDFQTLAKVMKKIKPSIIIHMAAQPLVRASYNKPIETFRTNVIGTANVLEAARETSSVRTIVNITTDKCYENKERNKAYKENDKLGGHDPYSSSKACAELVTAAYRKSFFSKSNIGLSSVRAGNVIGGGDWAVDRLIPDFFKALDISKPLRIRYPSAIRPWQHVLDPICGYLTLAEKLHLKGNKYAEAWNFGPGIDNSRSVSWIIEYLSTKFKRSNYELENILQPHESKLLKLDSSKAKKQLGWKNIWDLKTTLNKTVEWYEAFYNSEDMRKISIDQINDYEKKLR